MVNSYKVFLSAGEISGDILASYIIRDIKKKTNHQIHFYGIAGERMMKEGGIRSIFPINELSVMGYLEVVPKICIILFRLFQTILFIKKLKPDLVMTIDSPGFNFLLVKIVKKILKLNIPIIHYVAPTVWAYNADRAQKCAKLFNHMLVIFPFEKKYFDEVGLKCHYVGNPAIDNSTFLNNDNKNRVRKKYGLIDKKIITIIPGSRENELQHHLHILYLYMNEACKRYKKVFFIIPTVSHLEKKLHSCLNHTNLMIVKDEVEKGLLINISDLILCKSGTSVLECISKKIPMIVFYKMSNLTAYIIKSKLKTKYVTICNMFLKQEIIPELLQDRFTLKNLLLESDKLMNNKVNREKQLRNMNIFLKKFYAFKIKKKEVCHIILQYLNCR